MKISELIIRLEAEKQIYGDICVAAEIRQVPSAPGLLFEVTSIQFRDETFMRKEGRSWRMSQTEAVIVLE